jgi:hypothetical protein
VRNWPPWQACQKAPEGLVETLLGRRVCVEERFDLRVHAERCSQPQLTDGRASLDQKAGHVPAAVADRIVERAPAGDRRAGSLDIGPPSTSAAARDPGAQLALRRGCGRLLCRSGMALCFCGSYDNPWRIIAKHLLKACG